MYSGLFFGLPLTVTSFNRFSRLVEAFSRRLCRVLVSLYFDDSTITNPLRDQANGLSTNYAVWSVPPLQLTRNNLCRALEPSWAWPMTSATSTIQAMLSFGHVLAFMTKPRYYVYCSNNWEVHTWNCVEVVRYCQLLRARHLRPCWLWWTHGSQSSPGRSHSSADTRDWGMLRGVQAVMRFEPKRDSQYSLCSNQQHRFLAASDAAVEADNPGPGAFHLIFFQPDGSQARLNFVATSCAELQTLWQPAENHIAQLELSMVLYALIKRPDVFRNRQGLWFLDSVAAVMTLVRGRCSNSDLAKLGHLIHVALFGLRAQGYWARAPGPMILVD